MTSTTEARCQIRLPNRDGLHARPCAALARLAGRWRGTTLLVRVGSHEADATRIIELLTLPAPQGATLEMIASGPRAAALLEAARSLVERGFGEPSS